MKPGCIAIILFIASLFTGSGASCQTRGSRNSGAQKTKHMTQAETNSLQQQAEHLLSLSDEQYFSLSEPDILRLQESLGQLGELGPGQIGMSAPGPQVLAIGMPAAIDKSERKELPVLLGIVQNGQRNWEVELFQNLWFVLREANTGRVMLSRPFLWDKRAAIPAPSKSGNPPDAANGKASTTGVSRINVIKDLFPNAPWKPGMYYLTAIDYNWVSNSRNVELTNLDRRYEQAVPDLEERVRLFEKIGVAKQGEAQPDGLRVSSDGSECKIAFNLRGEDGLFVHSDGRDYFLCTLLLFKLDANSPEKINLALPVQRQSGQGESRYQASSVLELGKATVDSPLSAGYMAYLVSGPLLSGPHPIQIH